MKLQVVSDLKCFDFWQGVEVQSRICHIRKQNLDSNWIVSFVQIVCCAVVQVTRMEAEFLEVSSADTVPKYKKSPVSKT